MKHHVTKLLVAGALCLGLVMLVVTASAAPSDFAGFKENEIYGWEVSRTVANQPPGFSPLADDMVYAVADQFSVEFTHGGKSAFNLSLEIAFAQNIPFESKGNVIFTSETGIVATLSDMALGLSGINVPLFIAKNLVLATHFSGMEYNIDGLSVNRTWDSGNRSWLATWDANGIMQRLDLVYQNQVYYTLTFYVPPIHGYDAVLLGIFACLAAGFIITARLKKRMA